MPFRNYTGDFPFHRKDKAVWYFIIDWTNRVRLSFIMFLGKKELVKELQRIIDSRDEKNMNYLVSGMEYISTDIYRIPIGIGYFELNQHFGY